MMNKLLVALLHKFGVGAESYARTTSTLPGLDGSTFEPYKERPFDSWVKQSGKVFEIHGRLRMSDRLDEPRIFFIDVSGRPPIRVDVDFKDFHRHHLAYPVGTAITMKAEGQEAENSLVVKKVKELKSVFGKRPGKAQS